MAKLRPSDVLFWILATLALAFFAFFLLILYGTVGVKSSTGPNEAAQTVAPAQTTETKAAEPVTTTKAEPSTRTTTKTKTTAPAPARKPAQLTTVVLTASRGDCWFQARAGSANGRVLDERVLNQGESISINGKSVWLTVGAAGNLDVTVNGKPKPLSTGTISIVLEAKGSKTS